jgi:hypothetical protein
MKCNNLFIHSKEDLNTKEKIEELTIFISLKGKEGSKGDI